jgi:hypothetical protein
LMSDLTSRHLPNVQAKHFLAALDACSSGLALPQVLGEEVDISRLAFPTLSVIYSEVSKPARNVLVATTSGGKALVSDGTGAFTRSFISALSGRGDLNSDGVIQLEELFLRVKNDILAKARESGHDQVPTMYEAPALGTGRVLFVLP